MSKTLVIAISRIGDLIQSGPLLSLLKRQRPESELHLLVEAGFAETARMLPDVDTLHTVTLENLLPHLARGPAHDLPGAIGHYRRCIQGLRNERFDRVWNLTHTRPSTVLNYLLAGADGLGVTLDSGGLQRVNSPWLRYFFATNLARPWCQFNLVDIYANCAEHGPAAGRRRLQLNVPDVTHVAGHALARQSHRYRIAIHPAASQRAKCWPLAAYRDLARRLAEQSEAEIYVVGGPRDQDLAHAFSGISGVVSFIGKTSVPELAAVLRSCDVLITNDSGPMHVAAAVETRVIALTVGTALGAETAPYGSGHYVVEPRTVCFPCAPRNPCSNAGCAESISVDTVYALTRALLNSAHLAEQEHADARIYRTIFNRNDGLLDLEPVNSAARDERWQLNRWIRPAWLRALSPLPDAPPPSPLPSGIDPRVLQSALTAMRQAEAWSHQLHCVATAIPLDVARCRALGGEIERCELTLQSALKTGGPLEAVWTYHQLNKASLRGVTLAEQAAETHSLYAALSRMLTQLSEADAAIPDFNLQRQPVTGVQP